MEAHGTSGAGGGSSRTTDDAAALAELCDSLGECRRIHALLALREDSPVTLAELAADVAARERAERRDVLAGDAERGYPSVDDAEQAAVSLHHVHLPRLDEAGLVEFDPGDGVVALGDRAGEAYDLLDAVGVA